MSLVRMPFNVLSETIRQRIISVLQGREALKPIWQEQYSTAWRVLGWLLLTLSAAGAMTFVLVVDIGRPCSFHHEYYWIAVYWACLFFAIYGLLGAIRAVLLGRLPFKRGIYLMPLDLLVAETGTLEM